MPLLLKDFNWSQTDNEISLRIRTNGIKIPISNIFIHETYVKISYPPYYYESFLLHPINLNESVCRIGESEVKFKLIKKEPIHWETLDQPIERTELLSKKEEVLKECHERAIEEKNNKVTAKSELKREFVQKEIDRIDDVRKKIDSVRIESCKNAIKKIDIDTHKPASKADVRLKLPSPKADVSIKLPTKSVAYEKPPLPAIRGKKHIEINFSERKFPTPLRESKEQEENEWLLKLHEAKKIIGFTEEDLRDEERNPEWLKEKGNDFFQKGNYLGAISAYTTGIKLNSGNYELYLNRSAAHMKMENYKKCIEDCSSAYDLLTPHVKLNQNSRAQCLARRGAALCKIGYLTQGHSELVEALKLNPDNESLKKDIEEIKIELNKEELE